MKARLQYAKVGSTAYKDVGVLRSEDKDYSLEGLSDRSETGARILVGYKVSVRCVMLNLNTDFLDQTGYLFRLFSFENSLAKVINLGEREYISSFDALMSRNEINYHVVELEFVIKASEYKAYSTFVEISSDDSIIIDDYDEQSTIYV